jgi:hypothetical protein
METQQQVTSTCLRRIAANFRRDAADTEVPRFKELMVKAADDLEFCACQSECADPSASGSPQLDFHATCAAA